MSITVSSRRNPLVREYQKLLQSRRHRHKLKKIALEGPNLVREALKAGLIPEVVFFTKKYSETGGSEWLSELPAEVMQVVLAESVFTSIADTKNPQAVAAIMPFNPEKSKKSFVDSLQLILILDRLQDPGNMGTIIRTAAAAGVDLVFYTSGSVDPYSPKVLRSTAGAIFYLTLKLAREPRSVIKALQEKGIKILAACARSSLQYWSADLKVPIALIIGNEAGGISSEFEAAADIKVSIPLSGSVESLNAAVAAGVILFEIIRQRNSLSP